MLEIKVHPLPFKDILNDLANELNASCEESLGEYLLKIPEEYGSGKIRGINFPNGVGMFQYDCQLNQDVTLKFKGQKIHPLKFLYCHDSFIEHKFETATTWNKIARSKYAIVASSGDTGHELRFNKDKKIKLISIEIDRRKFQNQFEYDLSNIEKSFYKLLGDINAIHEVYHDGYYNLNASICIDEIENFNGKDVVRTSFLGAKALEMFAYMIEQYGEEVKGVAANKMRLVDLNTLLKAENFIASYYDKGISVEDVAKAAGTNPVRLQKSFKAKHSKTVNQYLTDFRLKKAADLIETKEHSIGEVAYLVGFKSRSHFTHIFKHKFGVSPKKYEN